MSVQRKLVNVHPVQHKINELRSINSLVVIVPKT